jgi:hypothetical protein
VDAGSIGVAVWIARAVFVILMIQALVEQRYRLTAMTAVVVLIGCVLLGRVNAGLITPFIAIADIVLVLAVHGRDFRLN